jgi:hypothetical protein
MKLQRQRNLPVLQVPPQAEAPILSRLSKVSGSIPAGKDTIRISEDGKCWISWWDFFSEPRFDDCLTPLWAVAHLPRKGGDHIDIEMVANFSMSQS